MVSTVNSVPDTRVSLILRLPNVADAQAWSEFTDIYEPFMYRYAIRRGLQDADAREMTQEVFLAVARAVGRWEQDEKRAQFRTWLFRIARNQAVNLLTRRSKESLVDSGTWRHAESMLADDELLRLEEEEYRQEALRFAAASVRRDVKPQTWDAFHMTTVQGIDADTVAAKLNMTRGMVYVARSRVIKRLRDRVACLNEELAR